MAKWYKKVVAPADYPGTIYKGRYCLEHILVYWQTTGILPGFNEIIHHIDEDKRNNKFSNLQLMTRSEHTKLHAKPKTMVKVQCHHCGKTFERQKRKVVNKKQFCNRTCLHSYQREETPNSISRDHLISLNKSRAKAHDELYIELNCAGCGCKFDKRRCKIKPNTKDFYCNRECYLSSSRRIIKHT